VILLNVTIIFPLIGYLRPAWNSFMNPLWIYGRATLRWFLMQLSHPDSSKSGRGGWATLPKIQDHTLWIIAFSYVVTTSWLSTPPAQVTWIPVWQLSNLISGRRCKPCELFDLADLRSQRSFSRYNSGPFIGLVKRPREDGGGYDADTPVCFDCRLKRLVLVIPY
jgi:hypothetical protein